MPTMAVTTLSPVACFAARQRATLNKGSKILTRHSENCFQARWAHQLPQIGHDLGMKSCVSGMHGLYDLLNNIR